MHGGPVDLSVFTILVSEFSSSNNILNCSVCHGCHMCVCDSCSLLLRMTSCLSTLGAFSNIHLTIFLVAGVPLSISSSSFFIPIICSGVVYNVPYLSIILSCWSSVRKARVIEEISPSQESLSSTSLFYLLNATFNTIEHFVVRLILPLLLHEK